MHQAVLDSVVHLRLLSRTETPHQTSFLKVAKSVGGRLTFLT